MSATNALSARLIGAIFLERGLVTEEQLQAALAQQVETKEHLGEILVQRFGVSRIELASVLAEQWAELERANASAANQGEPTLTVVANPPETDDAVEESEPDEDGDEAADERRPIGEIFVEQGLVTDEQLDQALETQRQGGERLGEILVAQGSITRLQLASALADQWTALRKIRPPSAPEQKSGVPQVGSSDLPPAEVDQLRESVAALEQRLRVAESLAAREPWREEISAATEGLQTTVAEIEARLDAAVTHDDPADVKGLRATLEELAGRVDVLTTTERMNDAELLRRVESAAEAAEAARSGLGGAFESLSLRLATVEARVHDRSDITTMQGELETLVQNVSELAAERKSTEAVELRDEVQRLLDEVKRRAGGTAAEADPALAERVETLAGRVDEISSTIRGLEDASGSTGEADALEDALAAVALRIQALETKDDSELEEIRRALAEIEARPAMESVLTERLSHYGAGPDELDALKARLSEVERRSLELAQGDPELGERVDALAARFQALEESRAADPQVEELRSRIDELASAVDGAGNHGTALDELRRKVEHLSARRTADPVLVEQLLRRVEEDSSASRAELSALEERLDMIASRPVPTVPLEQIDELRSRLEELSAQVGVPVEQVSDLRAELAALEERLEAIASRPAPTIPFDQIEELGSRLDTLEGATTGSELAELRSQVGRVDELRRGLEELSAQVGAPAEQVSGLRAELSALEERLETLADRPAPTFPLEQIEELSARLQALEGTATRSELVEQLSRQVEEISSASRAELSSFEERLEAIASRPAPTIPRQQIEELGSRLEALEGATTGSELAELRSQLGRVDELRRGLEELSVQVGAPAEQVSGLRAELAALEERLEAIASRPAPTIPFDQIEELDARLEVLEGAETGSELAEFRSQLGRVDELRSGLEELSAKVGVPAEQVSDLRVELAALEERLEAIASRPAPTIPLEQIEELGTRLEALESATTGSELAELRRTIAALAARRPLGDPGLAEQVKKLRSGLESLAQAGETVRTDANTQLEELSADLRRELKRVASRVADVEELAAQERQDEHGPRIETLEHRLAEGESRDAGVGARIDDVAARVDALSELGLRIDDLGERFTAHEDGHTKSVRKADLTDLRSDLTEQLAGLEQRFEQLAVGARDNEESLARRLREIVDALQAEVGGQQFELGDRLAATERDTASLRDELAGLQTKTKSQKAWRARAEADLHQQVEELGQQLESSVSSVRDELAPAFAEIRSELSSLASRLDLSDTRFANVLEGLRAELEQAVVPVDDTELRARIEGLEERFELGAAQAEAQVRATEEALRAGLTSLGERLAETESTYVEAGGALRRSIERLGAAIVDTDTLISERARGDVAVDGVAAEEPVGPFLAFVPNGNGYSLQEVHGKPPTVGEAMSVAEDDGEFVVTRVGRSPLPLDRRRCVYLEPRGRWELTPPNRVT